MSESIKRWVQIPAGVEVDVGTYGTDELDTEEIAYLLRLGGIDARSVERPVSSAQERATEVRECIEIMGGLMRSADRTDPRVDRPLTQQLKALVDTAVASKPEFRRTVPMQWDDTDLLICSVLAKLLDIASAGLLVDDDTARLVALGRAVEWFEQEYAYLRRNNELAGGMLALIHGQADAIYREAGVEP